MVFPPCGDRRRQQELSVALPLSRRGIIQRDPSMKLLEQLEHSPLPPRLLHLIIPG